MERCFRIFTFRFMYYPRYTGICIALLLVGKSKHGFIIGTKVKRVTGENIFTFQPLYFRGSPDIWGPARSELQNE
jgi:hypothetical protein